jgi:predicted  nucleic acid-binding Zn-ribbon protein
MDSTDADVSAGEAEHDAHVSIGAAVDAARSEAGEVIADVIEAAQERIEDAEEAAENLARAAMETHLGQQINSLRNEVTEWRAQHDGLSNVVTAMQAELSTLQAAVSATATLTVAAISEPEEPLSLTPPTSEALTEATAEIQGVIPEALVPAVVEESPAPQRPTRRFF